jgi:hypothetical protein
MITTHHSFVVHNQMETNPWAADDIYDLALPDATEEMGDSDGRPTRILAGDSDETDSILNHLRHLTVSSLSSYQEIAEFSTDGHLKSLAEVIVHQRAAQQHAMYEKIEHLSSDDDDEHAESLSALRSIWRCAIWNLEQDHQNSFLEYAVRAEEFLEEAYLEAAMMIQDSELASEIRDYALTVCGARAFLEDLSDDATSDLSEHQYA